MQKNKALAQILEHLEQIEHIRYRLLHQQAEFLDIELGLLNEHVLDLYRALQNFKRMNSREVTAFLNDINQGKLKGRLFEAAVYDGEAAEEQKQIEDTRAERAHKVETAAQPQHNGIPQAQKEQKAEPEQKTEPLDKIAAPPHVAQVPRQEPIVDKVEEPEPKPEATAEAEPPVSPPEWKPVVEPLPEKTPQKPAQPQPTILPVPEIKPEPEPKPSQPTPEPAIPPAASSISDMYAKARLQAQASPVTQQSLHQKLQSESAGGSSINERFSQRSMPNLAEKLKLTPIHDLKSALTLNQKIAFAQGLFKGDDREFKNALTFFERCQNYNEAKFYIYEELAKKYSWDLKSPLVAEFGELVYRRFL